MAIIIDKEKKRREIALSSRELLLELGIRNITVSEISKAAGVGKGTIYEYFSGKEDIVFEIISVVMDEHKSKIKEIAQSTMHIKEKIRAFLISPFISKDSQKELKIYREFIAISLTSNIESMNEFIKECRTQIAQILKDMLAEHVKKGDILKESLEFSECILFFIKGLIVEENILNIDAKEQINIFVDNWFCLISREKKC